MAAKENQMTVNFAPCISIQISARGVALLLYVLHVLEIL